MNAPDYISPITGYRVWQWDDAGLRSLNGEPWAPGKPLMAACNAAPRRRGASLPHPHHAPGAGCSCGIYAAKGIDHLRQRNYGQWGVTGEVYLWGTMMEHKQGWRTQFGYPKSFWLNSGNLPYTLAAMQSRLEKLIAYGADIFVVSPAGNLPLWNSGAGYNEAGLDYLIEMRKQGNERRRRTLKPGRPRGVIDGVR